MRMSTLKTIVVTAIITFMLSAGGFFLVSLIRPDGKDAAADRSAGERKIAYWRAPMNPAEIYDKPGKSAMGMDLVPVYEDELVGGVRITINPVVQQNMGLRTAVAKKSALRKTIRTYGHVTTDETRTVEISSKTSGWIETLFVDFTGAYVQKNAPLYTIYSPELLAAQEEYLVARRRFSTRQGTSVRNIFGSAGRRLAYFDIAEEDIREIAETGRIQKALPVRSPATGYVIKKNVEEGTYIRAGQTVFRIADLSRVWLEVHIYEFELPWIQKGQTASMTLPYVPGKTYTGQVTYVYPYLQPETRDMVVRLEFDNPDLTLKPDMYADVLIHASLPEKAVTIPSEAVIRSGERNLVFVAGENNSFTPRELVLGLELDEGRVAVEKGLAPGDIVVTSGQFLLDSESNLREAVQKMMEIKPAQPASPPEDTDSGDRFFDDMSPPSRTEDAFFDDLETKAAS